VNRLSDKPGYSDAQAIAHASPSACRRRGRPVVLVYNAFVSPLVQKVTVSEVLPIPTDVLEERPSTSRATRRFLLQAEPRQILERLLPVTSRPSSTGHYSSRQHPAGRADDGDTGMPRRRQVS
jgi:F0F1-type ATP synthase gamma subunit